MECVLKPRNPSGTPEVTLAEAKGWGAVGWYRHTAVTIPLWTAEVGHIGRGIECLKKHGIHVVAADDLRSASADAERGKARSVLLFKILLESEVTQAW